MQSEAVYKAYLKTWPPEPWFWGFRSYMCAFGEMLSKDGTGGKGADAIKSIVVDYMKTFKPKKEKEAFQKLIDDLRDGVFDVEQEGQGEQDDNDEVAANSLLLLGTAAAALTLEDEQAEEDKAEGDDQSSQEHEFQG